MAAAAVALAQLQEDRRGEHRQSAQAQEGQLEGAEHIAATVALLDKRGVRVFDVRADAEEEWTRVILSSYVDGSSVMAACTPSRLNFEGNPQAMNPRSGSYGGGLGDFFGFKELLRDWRDRGDFAGLEIDDAVR